MLFLTCNYLIFTVRNWVDNNGYGGWGVGYSSKVGRSGVNPKIVDGGNSQITPFCKLYCNLLLFRK